MSQQRDPSTASASAAAESELVRLRDAIDEVDRAIARQLNERARLVLEVGRVKQDHELPVYAAARERDILRRLTQENPGPFPNEAIPQVFREIISATRSLEEPLRVAYMGPEGTFSHLAALRQFGASTRLVSTGSIPEVFAAVERGLADLGIVPVENTTQGVVTQTLDTLVESELTLCGELVLPISHDLLSRTGRIEDVQCVVSHPQPLAQCRLWLDRHLPGAERVETTSTASAARRAADEVSVAAIASATAAETYGLLPVARRIEDRRDNTTRFLVIGADAPPPSGNDVTSVVFGARKDQSGALYHLLEPFARRSVNLIAIQARPLKGQPWEYLFFIDLEGHRSRPEVAKALAESADRALSHKVLGSFPRASVFKPASRGDA